MLGQLTDEEAEGARAGVRRLVSEYAAALARIDVPRLRSLWDDRQDGPFLVVDELHDPVLTWPDLDHQLQRLRARQRKAEIKPIDVRIRLVSPPAAVAYAVLAWSYLTVESGEPRIGTSRLLVVAQHGESEWRLVSIIEAPLHIPERS